MGVLQVVTNPAGLVGVATGLGTAQLPSSAVAGPGVIYIQTNDTYAKVTTAGYLNRYKANFGNVFANGQMALTYTTDEGSVWLQVSVSASNTSLIGASGGGSVVQPTITDAIVYATNTTGGLSTASGVNIFNGGNIAAGLSGTAGTLSSFPGTASKGSLVLAAVANTGNTATTISNAAMGQASVISIPDPGASTANFLLSAGTNTMAAGSSIVLDKGTGTEVSNAVTINKSAGVITTTSLTTAGGATETITLTNSEVATTSVVVASIGNGTNSATNAYSLTTSITGSHTVVFVISNLTAATALNGTLVINFAVF